MQRAAYSSVKSCKFTYDVVILQLEPYTNTNHFLSFLVCFPCFKFVVQFVIYIPVSEPSHYINPLKTKRRLLYLKTQYVSRSKHFSSRL